MSESENLLKAQLALWKAIARSRDGQNAFLSTYADLMADIADFWKRAEPEAEMPAELLARIADMQSKAQA
jgi:hypothetical protein